MLAGLLDEGELGDLDHQAFQRALDEKARSRFPSMPSATISAARMRTLVRHVDPRGGIVARLALQARRASTKHRSSACASR